MYWSVWGRYPVEISILIAYSTWRMARSLYLIPISTYTLWSITPSIKWIESTPLYEKLRHTITFAPPCLTVFVVYRGSCSVLGGRRTYILIQFPQIVRFCFRPSTICFTIYLWTKWRVLLHNVCVLQYVSLLIKELFADFQLINYVSASAYDSFL